MGCVPSSDVNGPCGPCRSGLHHEARGQSGGGGRAGSSWGGAPPAPPSPGGLPTLLAEAPSPQCCQAHFSLCPPLSRTLVAPLGLPPPMIEDTGPSPGPCSHPKGAHRVPARCAHIPACLSHLPRERKEKGPERAARWRGGGLGSKDRLMPAHTHRPPGTWGLRVPWGWEQGPPRPLPRQGGGRPTGPLSPRVPRRLSLEARPGQRAVLKPEVCADGTRGGPQVFQQK